MKNSLSWRLFVLVAGTLLALLAGMGLAAPAVASPVQVATSGNHYDRGADLYLEAKGEGRHVDLKVRGENYDAKWVYVKVVQINHHGRERVIDHREVRTDKDDDFRYQIRNASCGYEYKAISYSKKDGWEQRGRVWIKCDRDRH